MKLQTEKIYHENKLLRVEYNPNEFSQQGIAFAFYRPISIAWSMVCTYLQQIGKDAGKPRLRLKKGKSWSGEACREEMRCELTVCDGLTKFPRSSRYDDFYVLPMPSFYHVNRTELIAGVVAHELWHLYTPYKGDSYLGRYLMEFECEMMELRALLKCRGSGDPEMYGPEAHKMGLT